LKRHKPREPYTPDEWNKKKALEEERAQKAEHARKAHEDEDEDGPRRRRKNEHRMKANADRPSAKRGKGRE
jgi:uncharacterized protein YdaU (DUF1376 family)